MTGRSLVMRLALTAGAVILLLLVLAAIVLWPLQRRAVEPMVRAHLRTLTDRVAASYDSFDEASRLHPVGDLLLDVTRLDFVVGALIQTASGTASHRSGEIPAEGKRWIHLQRPLPRRAGCARCHREPIESLGSVLLVGDLERAAAPVLDAHRVSMLVLAFVVLGALLIVAVAARRLITRPLLQLVDTMSRAKEGDFLVRAPTDRDDEIGHVARTFNTMLAAITDLQASRIEQAQDLAVAQHELALRQQLEERNRVIAETNASLQRKVDELTLLTDLTRAVTSTLELKAVLDEVCRRAGTFMGVDEAVALLNEDQRQRVRVISMHGVPASVDLRDLTFKHGDGITGRVALSGRTILVRDTTADPRYLHYKGQRPVDGSFLSVPMLAKGRVLGVLDFFRAQVDAFDERSITLLTAVAGQAALAVENARLYQMQTELALTDALTSLHNRRALDQRLEDEVHRASRFGNALSALMIDVDHFKDFNDQHGHLVGDLVLRQVARVLRRQVRKVDTIARFGGEEFCVLLVRTPLADALDVAEKLRQTVADRRFSRLRRDAKLQVTVSIGVAELGAEMRGPQELLDAADGALYDAKHGGRNRVCVWQGAAGASTTIPQK
ncbi:MAG: diguanylate cyclase [Pseudomonadota bacterium]